MVVTNIMGQLAANQMGMARQRQRQQFLEREAKKKRTQQNIMYAAAMAERFGDSMKRMEEAKYARETEQTRYTAETEKEERKRSWDESQDIRKQAVGEYDRKYGIMEKVMSTGVEPEIMEKLIGDAELRDTDKSNLRVLGTAAHEQLKRERKQEDVKGEQAAAESKADVAQKGAYTNLLTAKVGDLGTASWDNFSTATKTVIEEVMAKRGEISDPGGDVAKSYENMHESVREDLLVEVGDTMAGKRWRSSEEGQTVMAGWKEDRDERDRLFRENEALKAREFRGSESQKGRDLKRELATESNQLRKLSLALEAGNVLVDPKVGKQVQEALKGMPEEDAEKIAGEYLMREAESAAELAIKFRQAGDKEQANKYYQTATALGWVFEGNADAR